MKIAYVIGIFPKLSETFILNEIIELLKRGHDVRIFSMFPPTVGEIQPEEVSEFKILERTYYFSMNKIFKVNIFNFLKYFFNGIVQDLYDSEISINKLLLGLEQAYFATIMKKNDIELIHAHFGGVGNFSLRLKKLLKKPLITSFYGHDASIADPTTYTKLFNTEGVITVLSNDMKQDLIRLGCPEDKIIIHHLGVDLNKFAYYERHIEPSGKIKFLCVGRLVEKKGIICAIKAFSRLFTENRNIELRIIGDGPMKKQIEDLIQDLGLQNEVFLLGPQPHSMVIREMHRSHIFVLPSISARNDDKEGTPTVLMEAQTSGMPVLSTYHAGIPEVVINGISGYLVKEKDINSLYEKMNYVTKHPELWSKLGKHGREHIEEKYNISKQVVILEEIYKIIVANQIDT
ncbi:MAG: glycosyltransferase [Candidatus Methanoperedens sp.]|nr:glycosyltransferase [Candidatus Methanoperedens sp.]